MAGLFEDDAPPLPEGPGLFGDVVPAKAAAPVSYRVLARTYRPIRFEDLIGQEAMVRTLRNAFALNRVAHAFLFTGVRGTGKTTTARIIARCLNCIGPDGTGGPTAEPCGVCPECRAILADRHPDVIEMDAASRTGVDDVREIIEATRFRPMQGRVKVFIIDEVHMLSRNAFNALLKTLEEPPPHVKFVFATTELRKVPVTVLSRCQRFDLRRVGVEVLATHFTAIAAKEGVAIGAEAVRLIARAADGSVRDGLSLLDQAIARQVGGEVSAADVVDMLGLADRSMVFDLMEAVMGGRVGEMLDLTGRAHALGVDFAVLLADLLELTHLVSRMQAVPALRDSQELPEAERTRGAGLAARLGVPELARTWQMLLKGMEEVEAAPDRRAAAEMVLIRLCYVADQPTPGELVRRLREGSAAAGAAPERGPPSPAGGMRAVGNGGAVMAQAGMAQAVAVRAEMDPEPAVQVRNLKEVASLVAASRAHPTLHGHLVHSVHLVRFARGRIELRARPEAPRTLPADLARVLGDATGQRWTIVISAEVGEPTLAEQARAVEEASLASVRLHPLVQAILASFPGAAITEVQDERADAYYGLIDPEPVALGGVAEAVDVSGEVLEGMPDFAPDDAEPMLEMPS